MLYKSIIDIFSGDFSFLQDQIRLRYLKIMASFGFGSAFGLVFTSHILAYVLKHYHQIVTAVIIGFISGSLGIVWPWKKEVHKVNDVGEFLIDSTGNRVVENYKRFIPNISDIETWYALFFILLGIAIILLVDYYGKRPKNKA
jgi:hypothetical protein